MFLTLEQNNSGYYIEDAKYGIGCYIIIEADNIEEAKRRLEEISDNYDESQNEHSFYEYCECCGNRWFDSYIDSDDLCEIHQLMVYLSKIINGIEVGIFIINQEKYNIFRQEILNE